MVAQPHTAQFAIRDAEVTRAPLNFVEEGSAPTATYISDNSGPVFEGGYRFETVSIRDGRAAEPALTLAQNGFQLLKTSGAVMDFDDDTQVEALLYPEIQRLITEVTGASEVLVFDHTIRRTHAKNGRFPAAHVHVDYTDTSAMPRLARAFPEMAASLGQKRVLQINFWRSIAGIVARSPLAFADASLIGPEDVATTRISYQDTDAVGEIYSIINRPHHRWYSFPQMTADEAVLILGYDSDRDAKARFTPHSAFELPNTPASAPNRESIEVRTFALLD